MSIGIDIIISRILRDVEIELTDEFDKNFERQAFFSQSWQRRKSPTRPGGHILVDTGGLRRSIGSKKDSTGIVFQRGSFGRKKNGQRRNDKRTVQLSTEAEFWKWMALMKVGKTIKIPKRQFLGASPEVERAVRDIIEENLTEYFEHEYNLQ